MEVSLYSTNNTYSFCSSLGSHLPISISHVIFASSTESFSFLNNTRQNCQFPFSASRTTTTSLPLLAPVGFPALKLNRKKVLCIQNDEIPVLEARCMDDIYDALAERLLYMATSALTSDSKYIVGLAGSPGAGKSTIALEVSRRVNILWNQRAPSTDPLVNTPGVSTVLPMDGFHLYRHQLDAMENPEEAHARRGAPWTFDPTRLLACLKTLKDQGSVYVPSFDHGVGDPVENDIFVSPTHKIVIVEGNYLLLEEGVWMEISSLLNEKWFIEVAIDKAMQRVLKRHISTGKPPNVAKWRVDYNDRPNAELINKSKKNADLIISCFGNNLIHPEDHQTPKGRFTCINIHFTFHCVRSCSLGFLHR